MRALVKLEQVLPGRLRGRVRAVAGATVAVGGARNAGLLAVRILAATDPALQQRMSAFQADLREAAHAKGAVVREAARETGS